MIKMKYFVFFTFTAGLLIQECWQQEDNDEYNYENYYGDYGDYYNYGNYYGGNGSYDYYDYGNGSYPDYYNYGNGSYDDYYGDYYGNGSYEDFYDDYYYDEEPGPENAEFTDCGGELTELPTSLLKTPNYPTEQDTTKVYPNNAYCKWWFNGDNSTLIRFKMWDLVIEIGEGNSNVTCDFDYLNLTITSIGSRRFCGYTTPDEEYRGLGSFTLIFVSDATTNFRGMQGSYQILENHDPCDPPPCSVNGECETLPDLMSIKCNCDPGFHGQRCEHNTNECNSNPCVNGGTCDESEKPDYYECTCPLGYEGVHCEIKINHPCIPDPCLNGGLCRNHSETTYSCSCAEHYKGDICEIENFPPCFSTPCKNEGTCHDFHEEVTYIMMPAPDGSEEKVQSPLEYTGFNCTCTVKYRGALCEINAGCEDPGIPNLEEGYWFDPDVTVSFSCAEGYILEGSVNSTCFANGTWSTPVPDCVGNETAEASTSGPGAPWVGAMSALAGAFTINLIAFTSWMIVKGPWKNVNRIINISQSSLRCGSDIDGDSSSYDESDSDEDDDTSSGSQTSSDSGSSISDNS